MNTDVNINYSLKVLSSQPLDSKGYFKTILEMQDLGVNNVYPYSYYELMPVICIENGKYYRWREEAYLNETNGILVTSFTYPNGIIANGIDYSNRVFNFFEVTTSASGTSAPIAVILSGNKTIGKYSNGQTIPVKTSIQDLIKDIAQEYTAAVFILPTASLISNSNPSTIKEIGITVTTMLLTSSLTQNDGGAVNNYDFLKNNVSIQSGLTATKNETITLSAIPILYKTIISYDAGSGTKNNSLGVAEANTIIAGNADTNTLSYRGYYKIFYGAVVTLANNSTTIRALATNRFENSGNVFNLVTGSTEVNFQFWLPTGKNLVSVIDLGALNADITSSYITSAVSVNDAGGVPVTGTLYTLTQGVPYGISHNHQITIA